MLYQLSHVRATVPGTPLGARSTLAHRVAAFQSDRALACAPPTRLRDRLGSAGMGTVVAHGAAPAVLRSPA